ncbi:MAG: acyloxyacyl hydrolase [Phycisphaerales bacterium JB065]
MQYLGDRFWAASLLVGFACFGFPGTVHASESPSLSERLAGSMSLGAMQIEARDTEGDSSAGTDSAPPPVFGSEGSCWWGLSTSGMIDDDDNEDYSLRFTYHHFIADRFEYNLALTGWFHDQPMDDEFSGSFDLGFRYHFHVAEDRRWTVYGDLGIGFMLSSGEVPQGGTDYNFTPRVAIGTTMLLPQNLGGDAGGRLDLTFGWQHYSNASTSGSDDNPARDSLFIRVGVIFPF